MIGLVSGLPVSFLNFSPVNRHRQSKSNLTTAHLRSNGEEEEDGGVP